MQRRLIKKSILMASLLSYAGFLYWILSAANTRTQNEILSVSNGIPCGDKIGHFFVMGVLALLVNLLLNTRRQPIGNRSFLLGSLIVAAIVTTEEFSQILIPSRTFCVLDLAADYAGIFVFGRLATWFQRSRKNVLLRLVRHYVRKAYYRGSKRVSVMFASSNFD